MYQEMTFTLQGIVPMFMHNGALASPRNAIAREMKTYTGKRKKTDADYEMISKLEWAGGLYSDESINVSIKDGDVSLTAKGRVCVPGNNIEAMLIEAARKARRGEAFESGVMVDGIFPLQYTGPREIPSLFNDENFIDIRRVKVQRAAVMRTRPIFRDWSLTVKVHYLPSILNEREVAEAMVVAGKRIGLGDYKPRYGRFEVVN